MKPTKYLEISSSELARQFCIDNNIELPNAEKEALDYGKNFEWIISECMYLSYIYDFSDIMSYIRAKRSILIDGMITEIDFDKLDLPVKNSDDILLKQDYLYFISFNKVAEIAGDKIIDYFINGLEKNLERRLACLFEHIKRFDERQRKMFEFLLNYNIYKIPPTSYQNFTYNLKDYDLQVSIYYKPDLYSNSILNKNFYLEFKSSLVKDYEKIQAAVFKIVSNSEVFLVGFNENDEVQEFDFSHYINNVNDYIQQGKYIEHFKDKIQDKSEEDENEDLELPF